MNLESLILTSTVLSTALAIVIIGIVELLVVVLNGKELIPVGVERSR